MQRNLTKAVLSGAKVIEQVLADNLTETAAYKLEYEDIAAEPRTGHSHTRAGPCAHPRSELSIAASA